MGKRKWQQETTNSQPHRPPKRARRGSRQNLLELSDELILRILSFLSTSDLTKCERLNRKLQGLAVDNEIWRERFFLQFVRPRARRIPGMNNLSVQDRESRVLNYSSKSAKWLGHSHLLRADTEWKRAYKTKFNWTRGVARASEVTVRTKLQPQVLATVDHGIIFTVDDEKGLRSWRRSQTLQASEIQSSSTPTALASQPNGTSTTLVVGFANGSVTFVTADENGHFEVLGSIRVLVPSSISSLALQWPYLLSLTSDGILDLNCISIDKSHADFAITAHRLANLRSDVERGPTSLSLRQVKNTVIASIVYPFYRFNSGWCFGLQELKLNLERDSITSRLTSSIETPMIDRVHKVNIASQENWHVPKVASDIQIVSRSTASEPFALHPQFTQPPNAVSFSGCYIVAGLPDNTLMVYTVKSTEERLEIQAGRRLWGHTSAVAAAEVTSTGKVLSISAKSDEMRYWELEDVLTTQPSRRTSTPIKSWTGINSALAKRGNGLGLAIKDMKRELELTRKWVGFDEEQAVILGERAERQILSCFDFA